MLFSSTVFLFIFLPLLIGTYLFVRKSLRLYVLLLASLFFYGWGEPRYLGVMLLVCFSSYLFALFISKSSVKSHRVILLTLAILTDLGILFYFKYFNFFIENLNRFTGSHMPALDIIMPIGISFFIFQALSYVVDVYRGDAQVQKSLMKLTLYISFFPQLIAGPIVKYHDIEKDLENNASTLDDVVYGIRRFIIGLGKKVLLANSLGAIADEIFNAGFAGADMSIAWLGAITYSLQLYFDFSGYSDMAIGLGRIFGFHFLENFNYPYISKNITEFWRRWHISLGTWFKEYVYIPLGGNRNGNFHTYLNLFIVFCVTGLWHGANWTFILWGLWHGCFVIAERFLGLSRLDHTRFDFLRHLYTILAFVIGWTLFRADTIHEGLGFISAMFHLYIPKVMPVTIEYYMTEKTIIILLISILASTPLMNFLLHRLYNFAGRWNYVLENGYLTLILILSISYLAASTYNPFIYFRF